MNARAPAVSVRGLRVRYGSLTALAGVDLDLPAGCVSALMGPSGSGKSTFLQVLNRLTDLVPSCRVEGEVHIAGERIGNGETELRELRRRVGMIFQNSNPFPLSIRRNLELPLREHGVRDGRELRERAEDGLAAVGLLDEVADRLDAPARELSGGQQQRLCIARALVLRPEILLMDEPTSNLDPKASRVIEELVRGLRERCTVVIVTHDLAQARRVADHAALFWSSDGVGRLVEAGPAERLFADPRRPITRAWVDGELG